MIPNRHRRVCPTPIGNSSPARWLIQNNGSTKCAQSSQSENHNAESTKMSAMALMRCGICLEQFVPGKRPPKLLPCGHNFCEDCLFTLCVHREYYLLDWIRCPKCRSKCDSRRAVLAPTNFDLCEVLERLQTVTEVQQNITVIHVPANVSVASSTTATTIVPAPTNKKDKELNPGTKSGKTLERRNSKNEASIRKFSHHGRSAQTDEVSQKSTQGEDNHQNNGKNDEDSQKFSYKEKELSSKWGMVSSSRKRSSRRCCDCANPISTDLTRRDVARRSGWKRSARLCEQCNGKERTLRLSCLECCVSVHSDHRRLWTLDELMVYNRDMLEELDQIWVQISRLAQNFDQKMDDANPTMDSFLMALKNAKNILLHNSQNAQQKALNRRMSCHRLLTPGQLQLLRSTQVEHYHRLHKMMHLLVSIEQQTTATSHGDQQQKDGAIDSLKTTFHSLDKVHEVITGVVEVAGDQPWKYRRNVKREFERNLGLLSKFAIFEKSFDAPCQGNPKLIDTLASCSRLLNAVTDSHLPSEMLCLFTYAQLSIFEVLNSLCNKLPERRAEAWKLVQGVFTELLRVASLHWCSSSPHRILLVANLAHLVHFFADVCDKSTQMLCMIEAARARATWDGSALDPKEALQIEMTLKGIDDDLLECSKIQKLSELCSQTQLIEPSSGKISKPGLVKRIEEYYVRSHWKPLGILKRMKRLFNRNRKPKQSKSEF